MLLRNSIAAVALTTVLVTAAWGQDASKLPDLRGQWVGVGADLGSPWDSSKPPGLAQQAPLTPEYQKIYQAALDKQKAGGIKLVSCLPPGMPRTMIAYQPIEVVVMPDTTYIMATYMNEFRRIYTDGRKWPDDIEPSFAGYSIGSWNNENGQYVLSVETRGIKGPRTFDGTMPVDKGNDTVVKERIYLDKANPNLLHDEVTTIDKALTMPWTVIRSYNRDHDTVWNEFVCEEDNHQVQLGDEVYVINDQGFLAPTRAGQPTPSLKYFPQVKK